MFYSFPLVLTLINLSEQRSFTIDYVNNRFLKSGVPFNLIGGAVSYFTISPEYWEERLTKARSMGINTVQINIAWNLHETYEGQYKFDGWSDIRRFLEIVNKLGLLVSLRPGPYVDAELDFGGFPYWLLNYPNIKLRTSDPNFINAVRRWFNILLPMMVPYLYENGGPIITAQVENEYGSYPACDRVYLNFLINLIRIHLGPNILLISTDGATSSALNCAVMPGVFPTLDFGAVEKAQLSEIFQLFTSKIGQGPFVNSEFYTGWLDVWGDTQHHKLDSEFLSKSLSLQWSFNTSVTFYMLVGGTFFGHMSGALLSYPDGKFTSVTTSYDYDAPISESGDLTPKYFILRKNIENFLNTPNVFKIPPNLPKLAYDNLSLFKLGSILSFLDILCPPTEVIHSDYPLTFEQIHFPYGYVLYETYADFSGIKLQLPEVHDRAYVIVNGKLIKIIQRSEDNLTLMIKINLNERLVILVENQGRVCYGPSLNDTKGLGGNVSVDNRILTKWKIYPLTMKNLHSFLSEKTPSIRDIKPTEFNSNLPSFYAGIMEIETIADTFVNTNNWKKGLIYVNGNNLGRYWPLKGPQITMYLPKYFLSKSNLFLIFELEKPDNCETQSLDVCYISFRDAPIFI